MNKYKHSNVEPKLSHLGLKVCKDVEGMIQLTHDKKAIHLAVRMGEGQEESGYKQLLEMKEMASYELSERSMGTHTNELFLSPIDMKESKDLEKNVHAYDKDDLLMKMQNNEDPIHPKRLRKESVAAITGWKPKGIEPPNSILSAVIICYCDYCTCNRNQN